MDLRDLLASCEAPLASREPQAMVRRPGLGLRHRYLLAQPSAGLRPDCPIFGVDSQALTPWAQCLTPTQVRRYLTSMKTIVSSKGQIVLPAEFRQMDSVEPGQEFDVERLDRGDYRLVRRAAPHNEGAIDWLLACPQKDFFVPIDSESTDAL
jgi:hypothetical protein